jgi:hypothetical protein
MPTDTGPSIVTRRTTLLAVIIDRLVLRRAVVPDRYIARLPAPSQRVFQPRHVILQHGKQMGDCEQAADDLTVEILYDDATIVTAWAHSKWARTARRSSSLCRLRDAA